MLGGWDAEYFILTLIFWYLGCFALDGGFGF